MIKKQKKFMFVLPPELYEKLKSYAKSNDISLGEVARKALESFLEKSFLEKNKSNTTRS